MVHHSTGVRSNSVFGDIRKRSVYDDNVQRKRLHNSSKDSLDFVQRLSRSAVLKVHKGCVNTVFWDKRGQLLLSGSDDHRLVLTDPFSEKVVLSYKSLHRNNIFSAKFLPGDDSRRIVSCSGDGIVAYSDLERVPGTDEEVKSAHQNFFECHTLGTTYEVLTIPNESQTFMSCGEDATVRLYDLREATSCHKSDCSHNVLISGPAAITTMDLTPISFFHMALGSSDGYVRVYDRRYLTMSDDEKKYTVPVKSFSIPSARNRAYRITSVNYSKDETEILVSYSSEHLYLFNPAEKGVDFKTSLGKKSATSKSSSDATPLARRLRIRGDWTDTGPESRPLVAGAEEGRQNPLVVSRIAEILSRVLARNPGQEALEEDINDALHRMEARPSDSTSDTSEEGALEMDVNRDYPHIIQKFTGHRNARTMIKEASFWGNDYVMSGSDCGHIFMWSKKTSKLVNVLQGDRHVVNCIQPHPTLPIVATSGIDYDIKLWTPLGEESNFEEHEATKLMERNDIMLEETRDTVTIPASFMIILLSSLPRNRTAAGPDSPRYHSLVRNFINHIRGRRATEAAASASSDPAEEPPGQQPMDAEATNDSDNQPQQD